MFLSVKQAACMSALKNYNKLIEDILAYSIQTFTKQLDFDELREFVEPMMCNLLNRKAVRQSVEKLFELTYLERLDVYNAFANDMDFPAHINDKDYHLTEPPHNLYVILDKLCNGIYDTISYEKSPSISDFDNNCKEFEFSVALLQKQFAEINKEHGRICPVCLTEIIFEEREGDTDHYFPRRRYPTLALHPYNLLPTCKACNGPSYKHTKSPIDDQDIGFGELRTVFLPYLRPAKHEIEFKVIENYTRYIEMCPNVNADENTQKRIDNLDRLYHLGKRWSRILSYVYDDVEAELALKCKGVLTKSDQLVILRKTLRTYENSTKNRKDFIKGIYSAWLQTKSDTELIEMFLSSKLDDVVS